MSEHTAENDAGLPAGATTEEEWGVRYGDSGFVHSHGSGYWGKRAAERDALRLARNANLPNVGQPRSSQIVHRTVTRYYDATEWATP